MEFLAAMARTLGPDQVQTGDAIAPRHHSDWSGATPVRPLALVRPRSTEEVSAVLRLCSEHRVAVVPRPCRAPMPSRCRSIA
jgi:FAD/FMN-containing dehydrogenase